MHQEITRIIKDELERTATELIHPGELAEMIYARLLRDGYVVVNAYPTGSPND